jgi:hypothetical protein
MDVAGHYGHAFLPRLGNQQSIERIAVNPRNLFEGLAVRFLDRQPTNIIDLHFSPESQLPILSQTQLAYTLGASKSSAL